jgi:hypothetical protein
MLQRIRPQPTEERLAIVVMDAVGPRIAGPDGPQPGTRDDQELCPARGVVK